MKKKLSRDDLNQRIITLEKILIDLNKRLISTKMQIEILENYKEEMHAERDKLS